MRPPVVSVLIAHEHRLDKRKPSKSRHTKPSDSGGPSSQVPGSGFSGRSWGSSDANQPFTNIRRESSVLREPVVASRWKYGRDAFSAL